MSLGQLRELGSLVECLDGKRKPINAKDRSKRVGDVPYYGAMGQVGLIDEALFNEPLVLIGEDGVPFFDPNKHKAYQISGPSWVNNHAHVVRPHADELDQRFLIHYLNQFDFKNYVNGTTRLKLTQGAMRQIPVPVPTLDEQKRIVEILEEHLSRLDAGIASLAELRRKAKLLRTSMLEKLIVEEPQVTLKVPMLRITDFATVKGGKRLPKGTPWSDHPTGHPYIRATNIKHGSVATEDLVHVPTDVVPKIARYIVQPGDVLITIAGTIGDVAVVPETLDGANLTENAAKISVDRAVVNPDYLCYFLQAPSIKAEIEFLSRATTQSKLALYRIEKIVMPVPNLAVQESCVGQIHELEKAHQEIVSMAEQMHKRAASLRRSLLHAAFTGQLTKEPANV